MSKTLKPVPIPIDSNESSTTTMPIISENDFLQFFNLEKYDIESFNIAHDADNIFINIKLNNKDHICPICLKRVHTVKDYQIKKITHSVVTNKKCYIMYHARRYKCPHCKKIFYENNPFTNDNERVSLATVYNILNDLKVPSETFSRVSQRYNVSSTTVINIFDKHVSIPRRPLPECLALDEVYGFHSDNSQYVCVLVDYLNKKIVDVLPSRKKDDLIRYFSMIPREEREKVKYISFDMWETYRSISKTYFPNGKCILDHFHLSQEILRKVDSIRLKTQKEFYKTKEKLKDIKKTRKLEPEEKLALEEVSRHYYVLKKFHWLLFTTKNNILDPNYEKKYNSVLQGYYNYYNLYDYMLHLSKELEEAIDLKDAIQDFYKKATSETAKPMLENLIIDFSSSSIPEMNSIANTLRRWKREIINSFIIVDKERNIKMNTAIVENRNKSIKLLKHSSNGYLNWNRFRNRILLSLNSDSTFLLSYVKEK